MRGVVDGVRDRKRQVGSERHRRQLPSRPDHGDQKRHAGRQEGATSVGRQVLVVRRLGADESGPDPRKVVEPRAAPVPPTARWPAAVPPAQPSPNAPTLEPQRPQLATYEAGGLLDQSTRAVLWQTTMSVLLLDFPASATPGSTRAIDAALREAIRSGRLRGGTRLPSTRALSAQLGVARSTVVGAYEQLVAEGFLVSRHGSGTTVSDVHVPVERPADEAPRRDRFRVNFLPGEPDCGSFPRAQWLASMRRVMATAPDELFGYGDPQGLLELRRALATYLGRARGVVTDASRIVVFGGVASALGVLAETFTSLSITRVAVEDPGMPFHRVDPPAAGNHHRTGARRCRWAARRPSRRERRRRRHRQSRTPVPARCHARPGPPHGAGCLGPRTRRVDRRGRLRRRVPLRPPAGRDSAGARPRARHLRRHGEQVARTGPSSRLARVPAGG